MDIETPNPDGEERHNQRGADARARFEAELCARIAKQRGNLGDSATNFGDLPSTISSVSHIRWNPQSSTFSHAAVQADLSQSDEIPSETSQGKPRRNLEFSSSEEYPDGLRHLTFSAAGFEAVVSNSDPRVCEIFGISNDTWISYPADDNLYEETLPFESCEIHAVSSSPSLMGSQRIIISKGIEETEEIGYVEPDDDSEIYRGKLVTFSLSENSGKLVDSTSWIVSRLPCKSMSLNAQSDLLATIDNVGVQFYHINDDGMIGHLPLLNIHLLSPYRLTHKLHVLFHETENRLIMTQGNMISGYSLRQRENGKLKVVKDFTHLIDGSIEEIIPLPRNRYGVLLTGTLENGAPYNQFEIHRWPEPKGYNKQDHQLAYFTANNISAVGASPDGRIHIAIVPTDSFGSYLDQKNARVYFIE